MRYSHRNTIHILSIKTQWARAKNAQIYLDFVRNSSISVNKSWFDLCENWMTKRKSIVNVASKSIWKFNVNAIFGEEIKLKNLPIYFVYAFFFIHFSFLSLWYLISQCVFNGATVLVIRCFTSEHTIYSSYISYTILFGCARVYTSSSEPVFGEVALPFV